MYLDWPETEADLVPLPLCPGPKLAAFDFQGPQDIEFLEYFGQGLHAHVLRVGIKGQEYALKLFCFVYDQDCIGPGEYDGNSTRDKLKALAQYGEPFNCECRAFGRLHETGHQDLAMPCYGYVLLNEENERRLQDKFNLEFNGDNEWKGQDDLRGRFLGERSGKPPPIRGIVKALGSSRTRKDQCHMNVPTARRLVRETIQLQQLGIIYHDTRLDQLINDKICDLSTAMTVPHFMTTPELNPHLSEADRAMMEYETFVFTMADYWTLWEMFYFTDQEPSQKCKLMEKVPLFPGGENPKQAKRFSLRDMPRRKMQDQQVYAPVDPRRFDWKAASAGVTKRQTHKLRLPRRPKKWYLDCSAEKAVQLNAMRSRERTLEWKVDDAGFIFPTEEDCGREAFMEKVKVERELYRQKYLEEHFHTEEEREAARKKYLEEELALEKERELAVQKYLEEKQASEKK